MPDSFSANRSVAQIILYFIGAALLIGSIVFLLWSVNLGGYPVKGSIWPLNIALIFSLIFFSLSIPVLIQCLIGPAIVLTIDAEGIRHNWYFRNKIQWSNIERIKIVYYKSYSLYFEVSDKSVIGELPPGLIFSASARPFGWGNVGFPLFGIKADAKSIRDAINRFCDNHHLSKRL